MHKPDDPNHLRFFLRRILLPLAGIAAFISLFYLIENIRGRNAWEAVRAEIEASGDSLSWDDYIPKPIPDEDNMLKAPFMEDWFVNGVSIPGRRDVSLLEKELADIAAKRPQVGTITFVGVASGKADPETVRLSVEEALVSSFRLKSVPLVQLASVTKVTHLAAIRPDQVSPVTLRLPHPPPATPEAASALLTHLPGPFSFTLFPTASPGTYDLHLTSSQAVSARDLLAWSEPLLADARKVVEAARRPEVYRAGDYKMPHLMPLPNFNPIRSLARIANARAQANLLLGDVEAALFDIEILLAAHKATGEKPACLVTAMIRTMVAESLFDTIRQGFETRAWRPQDMANLSGIAEKMRPASELVSGLKGERLWQVRNLETLAKANRAALLSGGASKGEALLFAAIPKGWFLQNLKNSTTSMNRMIACWDPISGLFFHEKYTTAEEANQTESKAIGPYHYLSGAGVPSVSRAFRQTAFVQAQAHLATLALALERHRLDTGAYPEKLDGLVPKYLAKIPHQVVSADPLLYRKEADGGCTLWSVGWDLKDDNGNPGPSAKLDDTSPDWAWKLPKP